MVSLAEVVGSAAADGGPRRLDRDDRPRSATPSRPATSGTPRSAPTRRRSGRTSRAPTRTRSSSRSTCAGRSSTPPSTTSTTSPCAASSWRTPPCPWTPPTADQPGLIGPNWAKGWIIEDNVIHDAKCSADLDRQGGLDGPQLRDRARGQARLPVPARVGVRRPPDRLGPGARRLAHRPPQHHLRLRPERHRRPPRLRVLDDRGQPHLQHRPQARVLRLRDRRHQAARGHRRRHPPQPHPRLLARAPGWTGRRRAPASRATSSTATTATCSSR